MVLAYSEGTDVERVDDMSNLNPLRGAGPGPELDGRIDNVRVHLAVGRWVACGDADEVLARVGRVVRLVRDRDQRGGCVVVIGRLQEDFVVLREQAVEGELLWRVGT